MHADFWLQRWREGRTGFHRNEVMPLLEQHWPSPNVSPGTRVLVPLCGKSLDMLWLAAQGLHVLGAELSPLAVERFFAENHLVPRSYVARDGTHFVAGNIEVILGDVFDLDAALLADCGAIYDRAALIALPPSMRERYVREVYGRLPSGCHGLLITLDYPQQEMEGPPFSVAENEVRRLFEREWDIRILERHDILHAQPSFSAQGVTALHTTVYRLLRHTHP